MTFTPKDTMQRRESGLFVPSAGGEPEAGTELANRYAENVAQEINNAVAWCRAWPRPDERPLGGGDLMDLCLTRARAWGWDREFTTSVYKGASIALKLIAPPTPQPDNRQRRRAESRQQEGKRAPRAGLRLVDSQPLDPNGTPTGHEIAAGYAELDPLQMEARGPGHSPYEQPLHESQGGEPER